MSKVMIVLVLLLVACKDNTVTPPIGYECYNRQRNDVQFQRCTKEYLAKKVCDHKESAQFIIECARAANPMSDEEGEDLVRQCHESAEALFCTWQPMNTKGETK